MKYASEALRIEHDSILFGLDVLEQMVSQLEQTGLLDSADVDSMVDFLRLFADKCHHGKEEGLMFPAMEEAGIPNENGPIGQMLMEHTQGRKYIAAMGASTEGGALQPEMFASAAVEYVKLMRVHINKENMVLFPMGDKVLPVGEQLKLLEQFEEFEAEVMGEDVHEKLHATLDLFEEKYLVAK